MAEVNVTFVVENASTSSVGSVNNAQVGNGKLNKSQALCLEQMIIKMEADINARNGGVKTWKRDDFQIGLPLGRGQYGRVFLAREKKTHFIVALKTLNKQELIHGKMQHQVLREIEIQSHLDHSNILQLHTYFHDSKRIYLVLEYAAQGELFNFLQKQKYGRFSERRAAKYTYQVADALDYCQTKKVMHRDIKPENLLLDVEDNVKLGDFGCSVHAPSDRRKTKCGTLDYLPPEMVEMKPYNNHVDHWCLGILCYEFLVGSPPFESEEENTTYEKIKQLKVDYPGFVKFGARDLISKLLRKIPEERISFDEVKSHPWVVENKKLCPPAEPTIE